MAAPFGPPLSRPNQSNTSIWFLQLLQQVTRLATYKHSQMKTDKLQGVATLSTAISENHCRLTAAGTGSLTAVDLYAVPACMISFRSMSSRSAGFDENVFSSRPNLIPFIVAHIVKNEDATGDQNECETRRENFWTLS
jgi:hypothetical protein